MSGLLLQAYQNLPTSGKLEAALDDVKQAAAAAGFKPRQSGWGEHAYGNLAHSASRTA
jgi:hypothetical protein